jgi:hypothetical protein
MDAIGCAFLPASYARCGSHLPRLSSIPICNARWKEISAETAIVCADCGEFLDQSVVGMHSLIVDDILATGALAHVQRINPISFRTVGSSGDGSKPQPASMYQPSF